MHALEAEAADSRQSLDGERLGKPGNSFDEGVTAANQHQEKLVDDLLLANNDLRHFRADMCGEACDVFHDQDFSFAIFFFRPSCSS